MDTGSKVRCSAVLEGSGTAVQRVRIGVLLSAFSNVENYFDSCKRFLNKRSSLI